MRDLLKQGILGLLNYGDMSGYEIKTIFQQSLNYFWTAQTSQIYRELQSLERRLGYLNAGCSERKAGQEGLLDN